MGRKGILLTDNFELDISVVRDADNKIISGLQIGDTDLQNMDIIIRSSKGQIKEYPILGVSPELFLKSVGREKEFIREVSVNLALDGYNATVTMENGQLKIEL